MDISLLLILLACAVVIGVFAVVMGGTLFLSLPLFQIIFPEMSLGAIIGNIKLGSVVRNASALLPLYKKLDVKTLALAPVLCLGSIIGSWQIADVSMAIVPVVLVLGLLVQEYGKKLRIRREFFWALVFLVGFYGGMFGAGILLVLLSLLHLRYENLVDARTQALLLELLLSTVAVVTFWHFDLINWPVALVWGAGSIIGGFAGGMLVRRTERLALQTQSWLIRAAFAIALLVALWKVL